MRRLFWLLLIGGLLAAAWLLLRELLDQPAAESAPDTAGGPKETGAAAGTAASGNRTAAVSKAELYREAQKLDVKGRSKMNKEQLADAVARARG